MVRPPTAARARGLRRVRLNAGWSTTNQPDSNSNESLPLLRWLSGVGIVARAKGVVTKLTSIGSISGSRCPERSEHAVAPARERVMEDHSSVPREQGGGGVVRSRQPHAGRGRPRSGRSRRHSTVGPSPFDPHGTSVAHQGSRATRGVVSDRSARAGAANRSGRAGSVRYHSREGVR
jgi:hypothetical protein